MMPPSHKPGGASLYQELKDLVLQHGADMDGDGDTGGQDTSMGDGTPPKDGAALVVEMAPRNGDTPHTCPTCGQPMP